MTITSRFVRPMPPGEEYASRLKRELALIRQHKLTNMFLQVQDIINLIPDIPHNIRGSAGSSLVCYLLGISHIDPLRWGLSLTRFLHELRGDMPDIDIDVPWNRRAEVWKRVFAKYGHRAARVSNRVMWRDRSIKREALRRSKEKKSSFREELSLTQAELSGQQRCWSLHCGGVVIMEEDVPKSELLATFQLAWNKEDVEKKGFYKIDILSSRALGQLADLSDRPLFEYAHEDGPSAELWQRGDGLGITGGESPAFRKAALGLGVLNRDDIILASALIRPAAASGVKRVKFFDAWRLKREITSLVYDDDCITAIADRLGVSEAKADLIRRDIVKYRRPIPSALSDVGEFTQYSFCKSHAVAYGAVVWALSYHKARDPQAFWKAALNNCNSMYRKWVHVREAVEAGVSVDVQTTLFPEPAEQQLKSRGYWTSGTLDKLFDNQTGDEVTFCGLVAAYRHYKKRNAKLTFATVWTGTQYRQLVLPGLPPIRKARYIRGKGKEKIVQNADHVAVKSYTLEW